MKLVRYVTFNKTSLAIIWLPMIINMIQVICTISFSTACGMEHSQLVFPICDIF